MSEQRAFIADSALNAANQFVSLLLGLATGIVLARALGPESNGVFAMIILVPQTVVNLVTRGADQTILYFVASKRWVDDEVYPMLLGIFVYLNLIGFSILGALLLFHTQLLGELPFNLLLICLLIYPLDLLRGLLTGILIGRRMFRDEAWCSIVSGVIRLAILILLVAVLQLGVSGAVYAAALGAFSSACVYHFGCRHAMITNTLHLELRFRKLLPALTYGAKASASNVIAVLNYRLDQFLLNFILGPAAVGIYVLAANIAEKLWLVTHNTTKVLFPRMATPDADPAHVADTACRVAAVILPILIVASAAVAALAELVPFVYRDDFAGAIPVIRWLLPGITALAFAKIFSNYLAATGHPGLNTVAGVVGILVNLAANLLLIPRFGPVGAAGATTISYCTMALAFYVFFLIVTGVTWTSPFVIRRRDLNFLLVQSKQAATQAWAHVSIIAR